jgi:hypothetical protein
MALVDKLFWFRTSSVSLSLDQSVKWGQNTQKACPIGVDQHHSSSINISPCVASLSYYYNKLSSISCLSKIPGYIVKDYFIVQVQLKQVPSSREQQ